MPKRDQHPGFCREIKELLGSKHQEERAKAGIITHELARLDEAQAENSQHPCLQRMNGDDLRDIQYLELHQKKQSIRVYFTVIDGCTWMLAINDSKRRTPVTDGMKERLRIRLGEVKEKAQKKATSGAR